MRIGDYLVSKQLGKGSFASVALGVSAKTYTNVALKIIQKGNAEAEYNFLKSLYHENVVQPIELTSFTAEDGSVMNCLVMEYLDGGDLFDLIASKGKLNEQQAKNFLKQILSGVQHCHQNNIVHRDLKPENILIDSKTNNIVITDFGLAGYYNPNGGLSGRFGSVMYCAPEVLTGYNYGPAVDIWSCGVIFYAMLSGCSPWDGHNVQQQMRNAARGRYCPLRGLSEETSFLLQRMLTVDPQARATVEELLDLLTPKVMADGMDEGELSDSAEIGLSLCGSSSDGSNSS
eukprot:CAMPEP_0168556276 /NCGR_PEP_ID=MMETSP0413-20121227/8791_1 /TAXON_ID=136452 /ORGANISM="Filamoeba nolandi, Strain NC-AS-23-1" /LENGTH=287 /DNA_ID=CAMNT_0008587201 /DNA_START=42 /DNA_END=905 /DNA_ORIENTATION=+